MAIHGCYHSVRGDINTIKNTLNLTEEEQQERGLMFVLKEIVQNADDCGADRLGFGVSQGLPQANHSLLQGPAIIAVNNGPFHLTDVEGIGAIGLSTKENDSSAVGKFGQGLKTVFLICEAFFYLPGPPGPKVDPGVEPRYMYNPWYVKRNDNPVVSWDSEDFSEIDEQYIIAERQKLGLADGFTLWIPLRQRELCRRRNNGRLRAIVPKFLEDDPEWLDREFQGNLANELAELMPLLKCIRRIDLHDGRRLGSIQLRQGSQQCIKSFSQQEELLPKIKGHIEFSNENLSTNYYGYQKLLNNANLLALKERDVWPTITAIDDLDEEKSDKQKAEPHCAVVLQTRASAHKKSQLIIRWAVFLPTEKAPSGDLVESIPFTSVDGSSQHIVLTLHGFFFLQSDRRQIYSWSRDDNGITQEWNKILAEQGTLRLLLPTLEDFAHERSPQSVKVLTQALKSSNFYQTYQQHLCAEGAWLCTLNFHEQPSQLQWHFERIRTAQNLLTIPESTFERLPEIFPTLAEVCRDRIVTFHEWPRLASSDYHPQSWSQDDIGSLLQGVTQLKAVEICADSDKVEVLCTFLTHALPGQQFSIPAVSQPLTELLRSAFAVESFQPADNLKGLIVKLPSQIILGLPKNLPETLCTQLFQLTTECLILPGDLTHSADLPDFSEYDAYQLLRTLVPEAANVKAAEKFAIKIFNQVQPNSSEIWQQICQLHLFRVSEIGNDENSHQFQSFDWLNQKSLKKRIFSSNDGVALARSLAAALQEKIYLLHESEKSCHVEILDCSNQAILELFAIKPVPMLKTNPQTRTSLLREMLKVDLSKSKYRQVLRYLLHGSSEQFENLEDSLYESESLSGGSIWASALKLIIGRNQSWRFVDKALLKIVGSGSEQSDALKIGVVDHVGVTKDLRKLENHEGSIAKLDWTSFSLEEREELISCLPNDLLKQLCLHEPLNWQPGQPLVAIDESTYLTPSESDKDFPIRLELAKVLCITLLRRCDRSQDIAQKQEQISSPIGARELVKRILKRSDQAQYWRDIMEALKRKPEEVIVIENLRSSSWLPLEAMQGSKAPEDIIYIKEIQDVLEQICRKSNSVYIASSQISQQVREHQGFKLLCDKLFPSRKKALEILTEILIYDPQYYVGSLAKIINSEDALIRWLSAFNQVPDKVMPAYHLLNVLRKSEALELFSFLAEPIAPPSRVIEILNFLASQYRNSECGDARAALLDIYKQYLRLVSNNIEIISQIDLLSQASEWQMAKNLCIGESIAPQYVLHEDLQGIITTPSAIHSSTKVSDSEISFDDLVTYFESWPHRTRKAIGILLRILSGSNPGLRNLSCQYLQDVDLYLEQLELSNGEGGTKFVSRTKKTKFDISLNQESTKEVVSLVGTPLVVYILKDTDNLIVGDHEGVNQNWYRLSLQVVSLENSDRLLNILKNTFHYVISKIYGYSVNNFDRFWNKVNLNGVDIHIARHLLLDSGILSLRSQIKLNENIQPEIISLIQEYSEEQKRKVKLEILNENRPKEGILAIIDSNKKISEMRDKIKDFLKQDLSTQKVFLDAVKQKIKNASYDEQSILFELFQNADDACCELRNIGAERVSQEIKIGYNQSDSELWVSHWGRKINQDCSDKQVVRNRGYDDDLIKMLLLNFSDKAEGVTGKFGLGFKSVFLAADRPKVVSGTLGLEVIGAVYPKELTREEFDTIERQYLDGNADQGTGIVLPEVNLSTAQNIISVFKERALYLTAFSRWLKTITIADASGESNFEWSERRIQGLNGQSIYYGNGESYDNSVSVLLLGDATRRCLLRLNLEGFTPLPQACPTFWVTTPTRMFLDVGIAVNAPFHPDIGRSQLDLSGGGYETNKVLAQELGREFGQALVQLFHADHEVILRELQLKSDLSPLDLWTSLWNTLARNLAGRPSSDKGIGLVRTIFWSEGCGLRYLYEKCDALPTGILVDKFNCLTRISEIHWSIDDMLSQNPDALAKVLRWPVFQQGDYKVTPGQLISQKHAETLEGFDCTQLKGIARITLLTTLSQQFSSHRVAVEDGHQIGQLISKEFIASLGEPEKTDVKQFLQKLCFQTQNGEWKEAKDLLAHVDTKDDSEEDILSQFAPLSSLLSEDYQLRSLDFFCACRITQPFDIQKVSQWILEAQAPQHKACILYLVSSKNRNEVIASIKSKVHSTWLKDLIEHRNSSQKEYGASPYKFDALLYELGLLQEGDYLQVSSGEEKPSYKPLTKDETQEALNQILQYWKKNKSGILQKYEESIYLREDLKLTKNNFSGSSDETKRRWLFLFMRAVLHSSGRTKFSAHKQFLGFCEDWGWMDVMVSETPRESDWLNLLNEYFSRDRIGNNLPYYQWVRYYPAFYAISKWWHVYRDSLLESNERCIRLNPSGREIKSSIDLVLNPRNNPIFQGTGIGHDAPPIGSILGMGSTFVIRELLRGNILTNSDLIPFAYVPAQSVREKLLKIGCKPFDEKAKPIQYSQHIHSFLKKHLNEDATFEGGYDLPILYYEKS